MGPETMNQIHLLTFWKDVGWIPSIGAGLIQPCSSDSVPTPTRALLAYIQLTLVKYWRWRAERIRLSIQTNHEEQFLQKNTRTNPASSDDVQLQKAGYASKPQRIPNDMCPHRLKQPWKMIICLQGSELCELAAQVIAFCLEAVHSSPAPFAPLTQFDTLENSAWCQVYQNCKGKLDIQQGIMTCKHLVASTDSMFLVNGMLLKSETCPAGRAFCGQWGACIPEMKHYDHSVHLLTSSPVTSIMGEKIKFCCDQFCPLGTGLYLSPQAHHLCWTTSPLPLSGLGSVSSCSDLLLRCQQQLQSLKHLSGHLPDRQE
ncbi:hypothetical protein EK904_010025 [Melospiza melodia maxima]|nr:hypothetical protein EK904_010025 [Melospiza melodia maxima]